MAFRTELAHTIFMQKYAHEGCETWEALAKTLAYDVCGGLLPKDEVDEIAKLIEDFKFIPGGRYLYYAGREIRAWNNCYLLKAEEDSREDWANLSWRVENCLMTGGGIGVDYSVYRGKGARLSRTGGTASGPVSKMRMINEIGREVMQGGSRRSALYASLHHSHADIHDFLRAKDWHSMKVPGTNITLKEAKEADFNWPAPLDMTNISVNYDDDWLKDPLSEVFLTNVTQALQHGEPGFSFNFGKKSNETLRNAPVSADTWVMTNLGYRTIADIHGVPTAVWTGKQWATTTFQRTKESADTVVVAFSGGRVIKADPSHEFLVERYHGGGKQRRLVSIDRVPAGDLQVDDVLHVSLPNEEDTWFDKALYTLGFVYGDGSFAKYASEVTLCTDEKKDLLQYFEQGLIRSVTENDRRGYTRVYMRKMEGRKDLYPEIAAGKCSFLAGLFDADGSYDGKQHRVRLASVHYGFLEGVRRDLETLGILSAINKSGRSGYGGRDGYLLVINGSYISRFAKIIPTKRLKVEGFTPYRTTTIKVISVTTGPVEDVYCCDVGVEEHSFCAEGVIISNCTEVTSEDDSDCCNLGSLNLSRFESWGDFADATELATKFLLCGTLRAHLPFEKVHATRQKNRRLGLGIMGVHEWLLQRGSKYEVTPELHNWLAAYRCVSDYTSYKESNRLGISTPVANRAVAPTGTIGLIAGTTTGIEPLYAVAYKRRYLKNGTDWHYQYVIDGTAKELIDRYNVDPDTIESAIDLAADPERRIKFQADVQDYVDQAISSTINLPAWGSDLNNEDKVHGFAETLASYAPRLRGFTCYPDGSRGGQPLTSVPYREAIDWVGFEYQEHDSCKGGVCGI